LLYVFGALVGEDKITYMLGVLLFLGLDAWMYGRWSVPTQSLTKRALSSVTMVLVLIASIMVIISLAAVPTAAGTAAATTQAAGWQPWSPEAVDATLAQGKPVFVDFTAAWCLSCKVNERVALDTDTVKKAFADKNVVLFRADWTHSDPLISQTLQKYQRDGVPLYLLYSPNTKDSPQVLPAVLTPGIVLDALNKI
jgi:thiol:disulfide interchange protein DsbD